MARRKEVNALWELLELWRNAVSAASTDMMDVVRELDLPDYSYIQNYRLTNEKMPLAPYLVWLFNGFLSNLVETKLNEVTVAKLINSLAQGPAFPGRVAPTEAISTLYGAITTTKIPVQFVGFEPKAWPGDIFVRSDRWSALAGEAIAVDPAFDVPMPEVLAVVTPACDLVPDRTGNVQTVTTMGGTLHQIADAAHPSTHFLTVRDQQCHVSWDPKWPVTIPLANLNELGPFGGRYRWVARLRELYHADLQQTLVRDIGRVGLPVPPSLPLWSGIRVLLKNGGQFAEILAYAHKQRIAWTIFSNSKGDRTLHIREDVAWEIRDKIRSTLEGQRGKSVTKLLEIVDGPAFIEGLQKALTLNKKDVHDELGLDLLFRRGLPDFASDTGSECPRSILIIFGSDAAALDAPTLTTPQQAGR